jgi:hypothetical protein
MAIRSLRDKVPAFSGFQIDDAQQQTARVMRQHGLQQLQVRAPKTIEVHGALQFVQWPR